MRIARRTMLERIPHKSARRWARASTLKKEKRRRKTNRLSTESDSSTR
jgi:hypothetical protein